MKCSAVQARNFVERPDLSYSAALVYGEDPILVSEYKRRLVRNALAENAGDDLYLLTLDPADTQRDAGAVHAALTSRSLLPGRQVALLTQATNKHTKAVGRALEDPDSEDAFLVVTAGDLKPQSSLLKLFETSRNAVALPSQSTPPTTQELRQRFQDRGMPPPTQDAADRLALLSRNMTWGEFESFFEKLATYLRGERSRTEIADVDACAPRDRTVQVDEIVDAVAGGDLSELARLMRALADRGTSPVSIVIPITIQFLNMYRAVAMSRGPRDTRSQLFRQPMHPLRRQALLRHCERWNANKLEVALKELHDADLSLRAFSAPAPYAVLERALMRIAGRAPRGSRPRGAYERRS